MLYFFKEYLYNTFSPSLPKKCKCPSRAYENIIKCLESQFPWVGVYVMNIKSLNLMSWSILSLKNFSKEGFLLKSFSRVQVIIFLDDYSFDMGARTIDLLVIKRWDLFETRNSQGNWIFQKNWYLESMFCMKPNEMFCQVH